MYQTLLVPIDGSPAASAALDEAIRIAKHVGARLHLMNIVDDNAFALAGDEAAGAAGLAGNLGSVVREQGEKVLRHAKARAEAIGVITSTSLVRSGAQRLQTLVARQAEESGADLIVIGTHGGRGLSRVLTSNESHLLNEVVVPVLLVRSEDVGPDLSVVEITATDSMFQSAL